MRFNKLTSMEQVSFKNRNKYKIKKVSIRYGDIALIVTKNVQFEFIYFYMIKRFLKHFFKFKYSSTNNFKVWVNLKANFPISRKSKNSRMGKGKGSFTRWMIKLNQNSTILEFKNVDYNRIKKLTSYWNKMLNFNIYIIKKS